MNISLADYYQKYPYIVTLRKYWLEYEKINEFPDYRDILSQEQIEALYNVIKKNTTLENYISGKKWGDNLIEYNYITNLIKKPEKEIEQDDEDIQETEIRNIFSKLVNIKNKNLDFKLITFFILPPSKQILYERLSSRDMKDKLIAEERMKQFERDVLHWINYNYVVINDDLNSCYDKIQNLIKAEMNNGSKDYDPEYIRSHVDKLTS